jgi:SAM-dependent methyltransferase
VSLKFNLGYRFGVTPWDKAGAGADESFQRLLDREEQERQHPFGRALDLGCGTGEYTRQLERRGWHAIGVDNVRVAVDIADRRGGPESRYVIGDVTHLKGCGVGKNFAFYLDVGCFNNLDDDDRLALGEGVTELASPGATLLVLCTAPHPTLLHPHGADREAVEKAFPSWRVVAVDPAESSGLPHWLRRNSPTWYRLALG